MKKFIKLFVMFLSISILLSGNVNAVTGSIRPPRMILRPEVVIGEINAFTYQIEVGNSGNVPSQVTLTPSGNLEDYTDLSETSFELDIGEYKNITATFILHDAIMKSGSIRASFSDGSAGLGLETDVTIRPSSNGTADNTEGPSIPNLISPESGEKFCTDNVTLKWSASTDPDTSTLAYEWQVDNNNDFSTPLEEGITIETEKKILVEEDMKYFWRVRAYDGSQYSNWTDSMFETNSIWECFEKAESCESEVEELESRVSVLEVFVSMIKSAICSAHEFEFCQEETCEQTDTSCGTSPCMNCNSMDGCYEGYERDYHCSSGSCDYTSQCTEECCDQFHQDADAYCSGGVCHEPQEEPTCTDECIEGETRCLDETTRQTCGNYDGDECTEWGNDELCSDACVDGECVEAETPEEIFIEENWKVTCPETAEHNGVDYELDHCRAEMFRYGTKLTERRLELNEQWQVNRNAGYSLKLYGIPVD